MSNSDQTLVQSADGALRVPFDVLLVEESGTGGPQRVHCTRLLRHLPGRRLVALTQWDGRPAVLKLFTGAGAQRYRERELGGLDHLARAGARMPQRHALVRAPASPGVHQEVDADQQFGFVVDYLEGAAGLDWREAAAMHELVRLFARLHVRGLSHGDPHLDNFLVVGGALYAVDGDGVRSTTGELSQRSSIDNLGLLLAQLPPIADDRMEELFASYFAERGWTLGSSQRSQCRTALARQRRNRYERYLAKSQRDCSEFEVHQQAGVYQVLVRAETAVVPRPFLEHPDALMRRDRLLKDGNSATVVRCEGAEGDAAGSLVIKRYNSKGLWHALRRIIEPLPRFRRAWCYGQLLNLLSIPTARPLALHERGYGPWRPRAWLLLEDLGDRHLGDDVAANGLTDARIDEVVGLFLALHAAGLRHGDTKVTNFLLHEDRVHLIDLDAMMLSGRDFERDVVRFLANWEGEVLARFDAAFRAAGLL